MRKRNFPNIDKKRYSMPIHPEIKLSTLYEERLLQK